MTRQDKTSTSSLDDVHHDISPTPEQLDRVAQLVASGELVFPGDLPLEHEQRLVLDVQQRRRRMLVKYIARTIALDPEQACGERVLVGDLCA